MRVILRKKEKRQLEDGKESEFFINERPVPPQKMARFAKRNDMTQDMILQEQMREFYLLTRSFRPPLTP
jgi:hypothetical protein